MYFKLPYKDLPREQKLNELDSYLKRTCNLVPLPNSDNLRTWAPPHFNPGLLFDVKQQYQLAYFTGNHFEMQTNENGIEQRVKDRIELILNANFFESDSLGRSIWKE